MNVDGGFTVEDVLCCLCELGQDRCAPCYRIHDGKSLRDCIYVSCTSTAWRWHTGFATLDTLFVHIERGVEPDHPS
jgi:hypothetical protein